MWAFGVDIGGTFTDLVLLNRKTGEIRTHKILTTPGDPVRAVLEGTRVLLGGLGNSRASLERVVHGTTLVTNALVERRGAVTGLVTTRGFRDVLEIRREGRYDLYDLEIAFPEPLVPRSRRLEAVERVDDSGAVLVPLDEPALEAALENVRGVESWAVCLLHAYRNSDHEERVARLLARRFPGVPVTRSSRVAPEIREYERTATTAANAYVRRVAEGYLERLRVGLQEESPAPLFLMQSDGGMIAPETAAELPIRIVESGPAGGVMAASRLSRGLGLHRVLSLDMGGTTAKISFLDGDRPRVHSRFEVDRRHFYGKGSGIPLLVPSIDLVEIGAGGGSLAARGPLGTLTVGPRSAGADPGPACYGRGGVRPTVTDADLVLGLLNPDYFLGGRLPLDPEASRDALRRDVAAPMGLSVEEAAEGVFRTVGSNMAEAARIHAAERGVDLAGHTLIAFGGAGPVHAWSVARQLRIPRVLFPSHAGVESALGFLAAPPAFETVRSATMDVDRLDASWVRKLLRGLVDEAEGVVRRCGTGTVATAVAADMRYRGQGAEVRVESPGKAGEIDAEALRAAFDAAYAALYGRTVDGVPVEVVSWRVRCQLEAPGVPVFDAAKEAEGVREAEPVARRRAWMPDAATPAEVPVFRRDGLRAGDRIHGPAIVEEEQATLVVGRGTACTLTGGAILAELEGVA